METRLAELDVEMAEAATDYSRLQALAKEQKDIAARVEVAMERWEELASVAEG